MLTIPVVSGGFLAATFAKVEKLNSVKAIGLDCGLAQPFFFFLSPTPFTFTAWH